MSELLYDIKFSLRMLRENRLVSIVSLLSLALGIGAVTAIFSVTDALLLRPLPYADPESVVMVWESRPKQGVTENVVAAADLKDWKEQNQTFEQLAAYRGETFSFTDIDLPTQIYGGSVSANFFTLLGVKPVLGRTFTAEEEVPGNERVVVMNYGLWQKQFGSDRGIINRTIRLNDASYTVVGVLPPEFEFLHRELQLWAPLALSDEDLANRGSHFLTVVGRLKPGTTLTQARAEMDGIAARLAQAYPDKNEGHGVNLVPLRQHILGKTMKTALLILMGAVGCVLLIACANVANLQLSLALKRRKESAIRTALGASRLRIIRQFLTESVVLSVLGGVLGLLFAWLGVKLIVTLIPELTSATIYGWNKIGIDGRVIGFTLLIAVLTGIIFGTLPALRASEVKLTDQLKEGATKGTVGGGKGFLRNLLVVTEVALAIVLLVGAGVMLKSFWRLREVNPGFNPENLVTMTLPVSIARYPTVPQRINALQQIAQRVADTNGVESVGATFSIPMGGQRASRTYTVEGQAPQGSGQEPRANYNAISPNYLRTMNIPLLKGRDFNDQDLARPPSVVLVNATLAKRYWSNEEPLGRRIKIGGPQSTNPWLSVIGIVADASQTKLDTEVKPEIYVPLTQTPAPSVYLVARVASPSVVPSIRQAILAVDRNQSIGTIKPMKQILADSVSEPRLYAVLLGSFAALALILAVVGIYSMMAYSVTQRIPEIGMRMALGAAPRDIIKLILKQALLLTLIGGAIGLLGAFAVTRVTSSLLFGITPKDPLTFVQVTIILVVVALAASLIPALKATRVDPMLALRHE